MADDEQLYQLEYSNDELQLDDGMQRSHRSQISSDLNREKDHSPDFRLDSGSPTNRQFASDDADCCIETSGINGNEREQFCARAERDDDWRADSTGDELSAELYDEESGGFRTSEPRLGDTQPEAVITDDCNFKQNGDAADHRQRLSMVNEDEAILVSGARRDMVLACEYQREPEPRSPSETEFGHLAVDEQKSSNNLENILPYRSENSPKHETDVGKITSKLQAFNKTVEMTNKNPTPVRSRIEDNELPNKGQVSSLKMLFENNPSHNKAAKNTGNYKQDYGVGLASPRKTINKGVFQ